MRLIVAALALCVSCACHAAAVAISTTNGVTTVLTPAYALTLTADGYPAGLRVLLPGEKPAGTPNMLDAGSNSPRNLLPGQTRGGYFYQDGVVPLNPPQTGDHSLVAQGDRASVEYRFKSAEIDLSLANKTARPMQFFCLLDRSVNAVADPHGQIERTPTLQLWSAATFYQGNRKLHIAGADRIWGSSQWFGQSDPEGYVQIVEVTLPPNGKRVLTFAPSIATVDETATVSSLAPVPPYYTNSLNPPVPLKPSTDGALRLFSPRENQVFQRKTRAQGEILLTGDAPPSTSQLEYRITGISVSGSLPGDWRTLPIDPVTHAFYTSVPCPAGGWYQVDLRASNATAAVAHVGIGEVFIAAGESNSTNAGSEPTHSTSGMVSTFGGADWRLADDPQPGANDTTTGGSPWPAFGDALYAKLKVPIAIAVTGRAGSSIEQWRSGAPCFMWLMARINELHRGGFRAILWQQGQSDLARSGQDYFSAMSDLIAASKSAAGWSFPWYIAECSYCGPASPSSLLLRDAQQRLWSRGVAFPGPDTDSIGPASRTGINLNADGLKLHGELRIGPAGRTGINLNADGLKRDGELWAAAVLKSFTP